MLLYVIWLLRFVLEQNENEQKKQLSFKLFILHIE